ncbi:hypothetical protein MPTK1_3g25280 [Marchantia polymorpha subsp. ruderalis]|uniref:Uncharacterized protein n=2 Tax=Marchantia polymorpha TaxID=3197 RepID=A0AAF6B4M3_MARPO|nr:hypothetical protein MARPO_0100s0041 [Marchantia polymorpha]BBN06957.1 hypothetical protein Mp_3g25280 [Marchantia polymorpha subsp. ruderalis]|eukprot:PTQ32335.1 hypothetical protein MARPO_0100s0041 [Marchantia polymorpha]
MLSAGCRKQAASGANYLSGARSTRIHEREGCRPSRPIFSGDACSGRVTGSSRSACGCPCFVCSAEASSFRTIEAAGAFVAGMVIVAASSCSAAVMLTRSRFQIQLMSTGRRRLGEPRVDDATDASLQSAPLSKRCRDGKNLSIDDVGLERRIQKSRRRRRCPPGSKLLCSSRANKPDRKETMGIEHNTRC